MGQQFSSINNPGSAIIKSFGIDLDLIKGEKDELQKNYNVKLPEKYTTFKSNDHEEKTYDKIRRGVHKELKEDGHNYQSDAVCQEAAKRFKKIHGMPHETIDWDEHHAKKVN